MNILTQAVLTLQEHSIRQPNVMKQATTRYLTYGDYITIHAIMQTNAGTKSPGVLSATGFADTRVFFQTLPVDPQETDIDSIQASRSLCLVQNSRDFIFQLWPRLNYEAHRNYSKLLKSKRHYEAMKHSRNSTDVEAYEVYEANLRKARIRCEEEQRANMNSLKAFCGRKINFGDEIQFMHRDSGLFLSGRTNVAEDDKTAYRFELTSNFSSRMVFKILPKFKIRQEGEFIPYHDQVFIQSLKTESFVSFTNQKPIDLDCPLPKTEARPVYKDLQAREFLPHSRRYEAHLSQSNSVSWRIHFQSEFYPESNVIRSGDFIRLKHTELQGHLAADVNYNSDHSELYIRNYKGEYSEEFSSVSEIWEIESPDFNKHSNPVQVRAGFHQDEEAYRLRHFLTGRTVILKESDDKVLIPVLAKNEDEEKTSSDSRNLAYFISPLIQESEQVLEGHSYSVVFNHNQQLYMQPLSEQKYQKDAISQQPALRKKRERRVSMYSTASNASGILTDDLPIIYFTALKDHDFATDRTAVAAESGNTSEHAFFVEKVSKKEKTDLLFAYSAIIHLRNFRQLIKAKHDACLSNENLKKIFNILKQLILFVVKTKEKDADPFEIEGFTHIHRQRLLKDMFLIEILADILYFPFELKLATLNEIPNVLFKQVLQLSNKLIKHTIREYRPNQLYATQWLELFLHQSVFTNPKSDLLSEPTFTELIGNNKRILETKIKKEIIQKLVSALKRRKTNARFVNLLRALTVCNGEAMLANQGEIAKLIFEDEEIFNAICYPIKKGRDGDSSEMFVFVTHLSEWINLTEFKDFVQHNEGNRETYDYFVSCIELLGDLCLQRNFLAINQLEKIYTYQICFEIISRRDFDVPLRTAFAKLFNNLWIDRDYPQITLPNYLIAWKDINETNTSDLYKYNIDVGKYNEIQDMLEQYFTTVSAKGYQKAYQRDINELTLSFLQICKTLIDFGFYASLSSVFSILTPLLKLLCGLNDVTTLEEEKRKGSRVFKSSGTVMMRSMTLKPKANTDAKGPYIMSESRYAETPENFVLMTMKLKVLEIIEVLFSYLNDFKLRKVLLRFKEEYEQSTTAASKFKKSAFPAEEPVTSSYIKQIADDQEQSIASYSPYSLEIILMDLLNYENPDLNKSAFDLLYKEHSKSFALVEILQNAHIIFDSATQANVRAISELGAQVASLAEKIEVWYGEEFEENEEDEESSSEKVIKLLDKLSEFLELGSQPKHNNLQIERTSLQSNRQSGGDSPQDILSGKKDNMAEEHDDDDVSLTVNTEYQKIMRLLKVYRGVMNIINYDAKGSFDSKNAHSDTSKKVLEACVNFLIRFVFENKQNQDVIADHAPLMLKILKRDPSLGLEKVISGLFQDNKALLMDVASVQNYLNSILKLVDNLPDDSKQRPKLLLTLTSLMKYRENILKKNQILVVTSLLNKEYSSILIDIQDPKTVSKILSHLQQYQKKLVNHEFPMEVSEELDYLASLLLVLKVTGENRNGACESKCKRLFPLKTLYEIYTKTESCYYLKRAIMNFIFDIHLDTEHDLDEGSEILVDLFHLIRQELNDIIAQGWGYYTIKTHQGIIPVKKVQINFVLEGLLGNLVALLLRKEIGRLPNFKEYLQHCRMLLSSLKTILKKFLHQKRINECLQILSNHYGKDNKLVFDTPLQRLESSASAQSLLLPRNSRRDMAIAMLSPFGKAALHNRGSSTPINSSFSQRQGSQPEWISEKIKLLASELAVNFFSTAEKNFESLVWEIVNLEKSSAQKRVFLTQSKVIRSLIKLLQRQYQLKVPLTCAGLRILRKMVENEVANSRKTAFEWQPAETKDFEKHIRLKQNQLCDFGVVEMICKLIIQHNNEKILSESFLLGVTMLYAKNRKVQSSFLAAMQKDLTNQFLLTIKAIITQAMEEIKKEMNELNTSYVEKNIFPIENIISNDSTKKQTAEEQQRSDNTPLTSEAGHPLQMYSSENLVTSWVTPLSLCFKFLHALNDGQYSQMQNHLQKQTTEDNTTISLTFSFVRSVALWFGLYVKFANVKCIELGDQILDFMISLVQGPRLVNQRELANIKTIEACMDYISILNNQTELKARGFLTKEQINVAQRSVSKCFLFLSALIEGNQDPETMRSLCSKMEFGILINKITLEYEDFCAVQGFKKSSKTRSLIQQLKPDAFGPRVLEAFQIFALLRIMEDHNKEIKDFIDQGRRDGRLEPLQIKAISFFKANTTSIEIILNDEIQKIYFPIDPKTRFLSLETKEKLINEVNRGSHNQKISDLLDAADGLFDEMEHSAYINSLKFNVTTERFTLVRNIAQVTAIVINLIMLGTYDSEFDTGPNGGNGTLKVNYYGADDTKWFSMYRLVQTIGIFHFILSCCLLVLWIILGGPLQIRKRWRELIKRTSRLKAKEKKFMDSNMNREQKLEDFDEVSVEELPTSTTVDLLFRFGPRAPMFNKHGKRNFGNNWTHFVYWWNNCKFLLHDNFTVYWLFYLLASVCALFFNLQMLYPFHLIDMCLRSDSLAPVWNAINSSWRQLLLMTLLGSIWNVSFGFFGFWFLPDIFWFNKAAEGDENICHSLLQCTVSVLDYGYRLTGGVGDIVVTPSYEPDNRLKYYMHTLWEFIYFIGRLGIKEFAVAFLVGAFAYLREEKKSIDKDMKNHCYICNLDRAYLDKKGKGFAYHIMHEHRMWDYLTYLYFLRKKNPAEYNGIENYVMDKVKKEDISWFPYERALSTEQNQSTKPQELEKILDSQSDF